MIAHQGLHIFQLWILYRYHLSDKHASQGVHPLFYDGLLAFLVFSSLDLGISFLLLLEVLM